MSEKIKQQGALIKDVGILLDTFHTRYLYLLAATQGYIILMLVNNRNSDSNLLLDCLWILNVLACAATIYFVQQSHTRHSNWRAREMEKIGMQMNNEDTGDLDEQIKFQRDAHDYATAATALCFFASGAMFLLWVIIPKLSGIFGKLCSIFCC